MEITDPFIVDTLRSHERLYRVDTDSKGKDGIGMGQGQRLGQEDQREGHTTWEIGILPSDDAPWKKHHFEQVLQVLRGLPKSKEEVKEELLVVQAIPDTQDISQGEVEFAPNHVAAAQTTLYVRGLPNISKYCYSNNCTIVPHDWCVDFVLASHRLQDITNLDLQSKVTRQSVIQQDDIVGWAELPKYHTIRKEFVYEIDLMKNDGQGQGQKKGKIKYIATLVRRSLDISSEMGVSGIDSSPITHEFTIRASDGVSAEDMLSHALQLQMLLNREPLPVSKNARMTIFQEYFQTIRSAYKKPDQGSRSVFLAPKPVTLEKKNILPPGSGLGIITILQDYTVTDKADGERMLLFIDGKGDAYFIDNMLKVRASGWRTNKKELHHTVIDGEYIPLERQLKPVDPADHTDIFAAFDIYFIGGRNVMGLPLLIDNATDVNDQQCRYTQLQAVLNRGFWKEGDDLSLRPIKLQVKKMLAANGDEMLSACKSMLKQTDDLPYEIDGLIFTPANLPVFGYYPNRPVQVGSGTAWDRVFKWKPEEMNTIDFLVVPADEHMVAAEDENGKLRRYMRFELNTGYRPASWEDISPLMGVRMRYDKQFREQSRRRNEYEKRPFRPLPIWEDGIEFAYIPVDDRGNACTMGGEVINGETIVEFAYDRNDKRAPGMRWKPLRVRDDKTRLYKRDQRIGGAANDFSTAMNIWRSIHDPVTYAMITGDERVLRQDAPASLEEAILNADDVYYARQVPREHCYSRSMLDFHNLGIKKTLYQRVPHTRLLELACGKAGDLGRWREYGFSFVLGVDLVKNNIVSPTDGAYARMLDHRRGSNMIAGQTPGEAPRYMDVVFAVGDCAKPLETGAAAGEDDESKELLRVLYGVKPSSATWMKMIAGKAKRRFDVVACQFAIHYFFKDPDTLHGFLTNVSNNLSPGGKFIGTCMDGERVDSLIRRDPSGVAQGVKNGTPVWAIMKNYKGSLVADDPYGKWVDVYLEMTHQTIPEYLVHFAFLEKKALEYGLELEASETFDVTFKQLHSQVPLEIEKRSPLDKAIIDLNGDDIQKRFSFLNRWFIFQKKGGRGLRKLQK